MENKHKVNTPDTPKSNNGTGKGKGRKHRYTRQSNGRNTTTTIVEENTSRIEDINNCILFAVCPGPTMKKKFLKSREVFLEYVTEKFGVHVKFPLAKNKYCYTQ